MIIIIIIIIFAIIIVDRSITQQQLKQSLRGNSIVMVITTYWDIVGSVKEKGRN